MRFSDSIQYDIPKQIFMLSDSSVFNSDEYLPDETSSQEDLSSSHLSKTLTSPTKSNYNSPNPSAIYYKMTTRLLHKMTTNLQNK